jgi:hypothetical protein
VRCRYSARQPVAQRPTMHAGRLGVCAEAVFMASAPIRALLSAAYAQSSRFGAFIIPQTGVDVFGDGTAGLTRRHVRDNAASVPGSLRQGQHSRLIRRMMDRFFR